MARFNDAVAMTHYNKFNGNAEMAERWAVHTVRCCRELFFSMWVILRDDPDENPTL